MKKISRSILVALLAAFLMTSCIQSDRPNATGKGNLRAINAVVDSPEIGFLIEERLQGAPNYINYKETVTRQIDDFSYRIHFDALLAGATERTRIANRTIKVEANTAYIFALTGTMNSPGIKTVEFPERQWTGTESVFEGRMLHLARTVGDLDAYYAAPGTAPVLGEARATLAYGEISPPFEAAAGDYELILTTRDNPGDILYRSRTLTQAGATSLIYGIYDPDPSITGSLSVRVMGAGGSSAELADQDSPPTIRLLHAAFSTGNVDLYANDDFTTPLVTDLGFAEISADTDFEGTNVPIAITPTGNTGVLLLEDTLSVVDGFRNSAFLVGTPATRDLIIFPDNRRPVATTGRFRLMHLAANVPSVDLYVYLPTEDINDVFPRFFGLAFKATTAYGPLAAGSYQVAITLPGEKAIIGGPVTLDIALGDIAEMAILDTVDPNLFDLIVYGD
jgi:hypothetical protein